MILSFVERNRLARPFAVFGGTLGFLTMTGISQSLPALPTIAIAVVVFVAMVAIQVARVKREQRYLPSDRRERADLGTNT